MHKVMPDAREIVVAVEEFLESKYRPMEQRDCPDYDGSPMWLGFALAGMVSALFMALGILIVYGYF